MSTGSCCARRACKISANSSLPGRKVAALASERKVEAMNTSCACGSSTSQMVTDSA